MTRYELLSLLGAAIALLVLAFLLVRRRASAAKRPKHRDARSAGAEPLRRRPAEREEKQPTELRVELAGPADERRFVFSNAGPGIARNVSFAFADAGGWSPPVIAAQFHEIFPIGEFRPDQQISCIAALHIGHPAVFTGVFSWEDEDGAMHETRCRIAS